MGGGWQMVKTKGKHALVLGGSIGGMCAAQVRMIGKGETLGRRNDSPHGCEVFVANCDCSA